MQFLAANPGTASILARGRSLLFRWGGKTIQIDDRPEEVPAPEPLPPVKAPGEGKVKKRKIVL